MPSQIGYSQDLSDYTLIQVVASAVRKEGEGVEDRVHRPSVLSIGWGSPEGSSFWHGDEATSGPKHHMDQSDFTPADSVVVD